MKINQAKLNRTYDVERLQRDLEIAIKHFKTAPQIGRYHDGSWTGVSLINCKGDASDPVAFNSGRGVQTEVLQKCHYFKEILENMEFSVTVARLLFLPPGKVIGEHVDSGLTWESGLLRIHIPIVTDPDVDFFIDGDKMNWKPGEFWFGDFTMPHRLHNRSDVVRVHIVMDCRLTEEALPLFPSDFIEAVKKEHSVGVLKRLKKGELDLNPYSGYIRIPGSVVGLPFSFLGKTGVADNQLMVEVFGLPYNLYFDATAKDEFVCNGRKLHWHREGGELSGVDVEEIELKRTYTLAFSKKQGIGRKIQALLQTMLIKGGYYMAVGFAKMVRRMRSLRGDVPKEA